ncbi:MAG TPA: Ig-like domain repeat protein, partial [Cyclobacteriaceae bacterium]|nr:Ig-like domain repeat protein [Cyclobacteriaceae bacterium]
MKKTMKLFAFFLALSSILVIQSCDNGEDINPAPTVTVDPTAAQNIPGGAVSAALTVTAPNGPQDLVIYVSGVEVETRDISATDISAPIDYDYTIPADAVVGSKIVVSFQVIDTKNYPSAISNFVITVGDPIITLQGILTTQTLDAAKPYLLKGQVFIPTGVTLTVPAGTIVKGDKATKATLIVQPGGKLIAEGTSTNPIVFTSAQAVGERDRGDWGGIVMLGNAFVNQTAKPKIEGIQPDQAFGSSLAESATPATNATENSGTLKYVRIEYAGIELTPNNETNSLTMGGIGNGTTIEYVQVSFGGDDGFEWFGGTVNAKYLVSHSTWDDDFDTDFGWGGNVQYGLAVRNPFFADQSGSNAFESDNQGNGNTIAGICDGTTNTGCTRGIFSNMTILGPRDIQSRSISGNYQNAAHIRRRTAISIFNSFFAGFRVGIRVDDQGTLD